jgi:hypothetical protein
MKNRLTHQQRTQLLAYIESNRVSLSPLTADSKARMAERSLGFAVTAGNVYGALRLLTGDDEPEQLPLLTRQAEVIDQAAQYNEISATHKHGKVRPHLLTDFQREVELLERIRRMETMMCKLCNQFGIERPPAPGVSSVEQSAAVPPTGIFGKLFGGHGRIPD